MQEEIRRLRLQVRILTILVLVIILMGTVPYQANNRISIESPNGEHKILLMAENDGAGIWIRGNGVTSPFVALFEGYMQGAAVVEVRGRVDDYGRYRRHSTLQAD